MKVKRWTTTVVMTALVLFECSARAEQSASCSPVTRANIVGCALAASLPSRAERRGAEAIQGRWEAASPIFPSNPVVAVWAAKRFASRGGDYGWYGSISQEIEIAGQRGARRRVLTEDFAAQRQIISATDRDTAANAWNAYFEALAAEEDLRLARRIETLSRRIVDATKAAAENGLTPGVEADVADAAFLRVTQSRIASEQRARVATATLATLLGLAPSTSVEVGGALEPLHVGSITAEMADPIAAQRPAVQALDAQRRALQAKADYYRRARWPNPTLSVFVQNDEINQPVFGLGLSFPLVLPQPIGRTYAGEIHESDALSRRLATEADQARREARQELVETLQAFDAAKEARDLYSDARVARADDGLQSIATEIEAGRLAVREAIVAQQAFMDVLRGSVEAKRALCAASVSLARAAGIPLEHGGAS